MKARIVITQEGTLTVFVDEGTFEEASVAAKNCDSPARRRVIVTADEPEQHRHDPDVKHVVLDTPATQCGRGMEGHGHVH